MGQLISFFQSKGARLTWDDHKTTRLFLRYQNNDDSQAKEELFLYYINLVEYLASTYSEKGVEHDDLFQEGSIGLLSAIEHYDLSRGFRFSTYSSSVIKGRMRQYFRDCSWPCYVPRSCKEMSFHVYRLAEQLGHLPSAEEAAEYADVPADRFDEAMAAYQVWSTGQLSELSTSAEAACSASCISHDSEEINERLSLQHTIEENLSPTEANVIYLYYYADLSQHEIADCLDTYQMRISRALHQGLAKLEVALREERLVS